MRQRQLLGPDLVDVELVEVDETSDAARSPGGPPPPDDAAPVDEAPPPGTAHRGLLRWVGVAVVVLLAVTLVGVNVLDARREAARRALLADLPWVLQPLSGPPDEVWRVPGGEILGGTADVLLVADPVGLEGLRALDPVTGEIVWHRETGGQRESCVPPFEVRSRELGAEVALPRVVACIPWANYMESNRPPAPGTTTTVTLLDPDTGGEMRALEVEGAVLARLGVADDLLVGAVLPGGELEISRWDLAGGEQLWAHRSPPEIMSRGLYGGWGHWADATTITFEVDGWRAVLDLTTGEAVAEPEPAEPGPWTTSLPDGSTLVWELHRRMLRVLGPDGKERFSSSASPWPAQYSDGSVPEVVMVDAARPGYYFSSVLTEVQDIRGLDVASGEELWVLGIPHDAGWPVLHIDGVVVTSGPSVQAIDVRTGRLLWEREAEVTGVGGPLTDGELVLLPTREAGRGFELVAVDLRTGTEAWRAPVEQAAHGIEARNGTVVVLGEADLVGYR